jgi:uncharacterized membrane protein (DUF106 family)
LNELGEEQEEAVRQQDFIQAHILSEKLKELQEELQRLDAQPNVAHEQVEVLLLLISVLLYDIIHFIWCIHKIFDMPNTHRG